MEPTRTKNKQGFLNRGGAWVVTQAGLLFAVFFLGLFWRGQWTGPAGMVLGALALTIAAGCGLGGALALGRNLTPFPRPSPSARLVQHGIYAWIRHPLYTAVTCAALGWALLWASWPSLLTALALAPFFDAKARREEHWLRAQFPEYADYERRVRRFIPWVY